MKKRAHRRSLVDTHDLAHNGILSFRSVASLPLSGASHPTGPTLLGGLGGVHVGVIVLAFVFAILSVNEDKQHVFESLEKEPPCSCKTRSLAVLSSPLGFSDLSLRLKDLCVFLFSGRGHHAESKRFKCCHPSSWLCKSVSWSEMHWKRERMVKPTESRKKEKASNIFYHKLCLAKKQDGAHEPECKHVPKAKTNVSHETSSKSPAETPIGAHTSRSPAKQFRDSSPSKRHPLTRQSQCDSDIHLYHNSQPPDSLRLPRIFPRPHV